MRGAYTGHTGPYRDPLRHTFLPFIPKLSIVSS